MRRARVYPVLYVLRLSTVTTQSLIRLAIFSQIGPPPTVDAWPRYESVYVKCLSAYLLEDTTNHCQVQKRSGCQAES